MAADEQARLSVCPSTSLDRLRLRVESLKARTASFSTTLRQHCKDLDQRVKLGSMPEGMISL